MNSAPSHAASQSGGRWQDEIERAADATFPGEWKILHDQPEGDNVVVAIDRARGEQVLIAAFDRADDAKFLIAAREFLLSRGVEGLLPWQSN